MNPDEFKPFTLEVKTLAEAFALKIKLNCNFNEAANEYHDLPVNDGMERLEKADQALYDRVDSLFEPDPDEVGEWILDTPMLDGDGEFKADLHHEGRVYLNRADLPQLKCAVAAFEAAS